MQGRVILTNEVAERLASPVASEPVFETVYIDQRTQVQYIAEQMQNFSGVLKPLYQIMNEWDKLSTESQLFRVVSGSQPKYVEIKLQEMIFNFRNCIVVTLTEVSELIDLIKAQSRNRLETLLTLNISRQMMSPIQSIVQMATDSQRLNRVSALRAKMELMVYTAQIVYFQIQEDLDRCCLDSGTYQPDLRSVVQPVVEKMKQQAKIKGVNLCEVSMVD